MQTMPSPIVWSSWRTTRTLALLWLAFPCSGCGSTSPRSETSSEPSSRVDAATESSASADGGMSASATQASESAKTRHKASSLFLRWEVSHPHWGHEKIEVMQDGEARYWLQAPKTQGGRSQRGALKLSPEDLEALQGTFKEQKLCALSSTREAADANESKPTLEVHAGSLECSVSLWFGEWKEAGAAAACLQAVAALRTRLQATVL